MHGFDYSQAEIERLVGERLGLRVSCVECLGGGRNSRVYRFDDGGTGRYAVKFYFPRSVNGRSGLESEFTGLQFLWKNGVESIARPVDADRPHRYAVFEYIDGRKIAPENITACDIDRAVDFLVGLKGLKTAEGSRSLPAASEACFSCQAIVRNIEQRLRRLAPPEERRTPPPALQLFLEDEFMPVLEEVIRWCSTRLDAAKISFAADLEKDRRTLSPSDFGFHNALKTRDGRIVFLDFEHFGWDDPAKMIADFLLHPAMLLAEELRQRFFARIIEGFAEDGQLFERTRIVYPLFALKWCMILLNEFVPEDLSRREFASETVLDREALKAGQLTKTRMMLDRVRREYSAFPYSAN